MPTLSPGWQIVKLENYHDRLSFDCGEEALNHYLQKFAGQHIRNNLSRTFVALINNTSKILGFYTLSAGEINFNNLPSQLKKKFPKYPIPIARIGRLAVDKAVQNQKLGQCLLMDALYRCVNLSNEMGIVGIIVDAKHEKAEKFYLKYGFANLTNAPLILFISIKEVIVAVQEEKDFHIQLKEQEPVLI